MLFKSKMSITIHYLTFITLILSVHFDTNSGSEPSRISFENTPLILPDENGYYPIAVPGVTEVL